MNDWLFKKISETKSYFAAVIMLAAILHLPYSVFFWVSLGMLLVDNDYLQKILSTVSPQLKAKIASWTK